MKTSEKQIIVNHSAKDLYNIVLDIEKYPEFIPWCNQIIIKTKSNNKILADMVVSYKPFFPQVFTSHVVYNSKELSINTKYIEGPLKNLNTNWIFKKLNNKKTKISFKLEFEFSNFVHQRLAEFFYNWIENKMINSFIERANKILD